MTYFGKTEQADQTMKAAQTFGVKAVAIRADSADAEALVAVVEQTVKELGGLDILVNNAGIAVISALSRQEASCLIRRMKTGEMLCFLRLRQENQIPRDAAYFPTYRHVVAIRLIALDLGWSKDHLENWPKKYVKVASIAELDRQGARKAFLGSMQIRKHLSNRSLAEEMKQRANSQ